MEERTHRAIVLRAFGGPEALQLEEVPTLAPGPGEASVRVEAAGVAYAQLLMRRGVYAHAPPLPFVPGAELAGVVERVGPGVGWPRPGDRVLAFSGVGGFAERAIVPAALLVAAPGDQDPAVLAALPMNYLTAFHLLHEVARLEPGETVLVHGGGGGVGTALLQLCRDAGVRALATASAAKAVLVRGLGAEPIDRQGEDFVQRALELTHGRGVDAVLDPIGGAHVERSRRALRPGGRLVVYGYQGQGAYEPEARARVAELLRSSGGLTYSLGERFQRDPASVRAGLETLVRLLAAGRIAPVVAGRLPLAQAGHALALLEQGEVAGKLVLLPGAPAAGVQP
jgi:NADPH:quinone reductase-like Zn-dependent oxidoreductase